MSNKSNIYISKKCPHCIKLLGLLGKLPELRGSINILSLEDNRDMFPKIIERVPMMISNGEVWNADELFKILEQKLRERSNIAQQEMGQQAEKARMESAGQQAMRQQQMGQQQMGQQQMGQQQMGQQQMGQQQMGQQQMGQQPEQNTEGMFDGYTSSGSDLMFASLDGNDNIVSDSMYESIGGDNNGMNNIDVANDGYLSKKANKIDNDYETMMKERGEIRPNRPR
jgi:hypothetical protein